jgi:ketosteroid isomerase-like protein
VADEPNVERDIALARRAAGTWDAVARTSGLRLDAQPAMWLSHVRDGKIVRHETFTDPDEAYRAAGLEPPTR